MAHSQFIEDMYQQYLKYPDSLEPSWKAFFQGFDFALENYSDEEAVQEIKSFASQAENSNVNISEISEDIRREFKVINLIEAYRVRGHLFTKPIRLEREDTSNLLWILKILDLLDLNRKFNSATETGMPGPATLSEIIRHLQNIYCDSIG
jgi:2-oxoglutarate dehydrogenase E1 component